MPQTDAIDDAEGEYDYFGPVEREGFDLQDAIDSTDKFIGYSDRGAIKTWGLFGGKATTDDPENLHYAGENGMGLKLVKQTCRAALDIDDFPGHIRFVRALEDVRSRKVYDDPFGDYQFDLFLSEMDHQLHRPLVNGLVEYFETEYEGHKDVRALEFEMSGYSAAEKFRAIYPWMRREDELEAADDPPTDYEGADMIRNLAQDLTSVPYDCRHAHRLSVTIHCYNQHSTRRDDDREFTPDDFHGAEERYIIDKDRRSTTERALDAASVNTRNTNISYKLTLTADRDDIEERITDDSERSVASADDFARKLGRQHAVDTYGDDVNATVGVVRRDEQDETIKFTLSVQASRR